MVSFSCEVCNDTMPKKKLMGHFGRCPQASFTCIDCGTNFQGNTFQQHTSCVTEAEKYGHHKGVKPSSSKPANDRTKVVNDESISIGLKDKGEDKHQLPTVLKVEKATPLRKLLKQLSKNRNMDKKQLMKNLTILPDGTLQLKEV